MEIKKVTSLRDLKKFVKFPFSIYKNNKYWVPPLISDDMNTLRRDRNPAFDMCEAEYWLAYQDGRIVGRIAGIINHDYVKVHGKKQARFCWLEMTEDFQVCEKLVRTAENWAEEKGMTHLHGPLGFTDFDRDGMLIKGFDQLGTFALSYNHPYYPEFIEKLGYKKEKDWLEFDITTPDEVPEKVIRIQELVLKRSGLTLVPAKTRKQLMPYARRIFHLLNEAYKDLFEFMPLSDRQIDNYVDQFFGFINPDFIKVIVNQDGKLVAAGIAIPSLSHALQKSKGRLFPFGFVHFLKALKKPDILDLYLVGILPEYQGRGVNSILMTEITRSAISYGIKRAESLAELEDNKAVQDLWKHYQARNHKRRRCYTKKL